MTYREYISCITRPQNRLEYQDRRWTRQMVGLSMWVQTVPCMSLGLKDAVAAVWGKDTEMWYYAAVWFSCSQPRMDSEVSREASGLSWDLCVVIWRMSGAEGPRQISQGSDGQIEGPCENELPAAIAQCSQGRAAWEVGAPVDGHDQVERESPSAGHHGRNEGCLATKKSWKSLHMLVATITSCHFLGT